MKKTNIIMSLFIGLFVLCIIGIATATPILDTLDTGSLDFGTEVPVGTTTNHTTTINNIGDTELTISDIIIVDPHFTVNVTGQIIIPAGESTNLYLTFTPDSASEFSDSMYIYSDDENSPLNIILNGIGIATNCIPDWQCSSLSACTAGNPPVTFDNHGIGSVNNVQSCLAVTDLNTCGETFSGNLADYNPATCDIPSRFDIQLSTFEEFTTCGQATITNTVEQPNLFGYFWNTTFAWSDGGPVTYYGNSGDIFLSSNDNYCGTFNFDTTGNIVMDCKGRTFHVRGVGQNNGLGKVFGVTGTSADTLTIQNCNFVNAGVGADIVIVRPTGDVTINFVNVTSQIPLIPPCEESWQQTLVPETCGAQDTYQTIIYTDTNHCGTTIDLPANNGSSIICPEITSCGTVNKSISKDGKKFIFENKCLIMTVPKKYNANDITMQMKPSMLEFKVYFDSVYEKDKGTKAVKSVKNLFDNLNYTTTDNNSVTFSNANVNISYVLSNDRVKINGVVSDYIFDYPNSSLELKYGYKGNGKIVFPPVLINATIKKNGKVKYTVEGGKTYAYEELDDTTFTLFDPMFLPEQTKGSDGSGSGMITSSGTWPDNTVTETAPALSIANTGMTGTVNPFMGFWNWLKGIFKM